MGIWIGVSLLVLMFCGAIFQRNKEKKIWNNGISPYTYEKWKMFDMDSQGGRGYFDGKNRIWISYAVDKEKP